MKVIYLNYFIYNNYYYNYNSSKIYQKQKLQMINFKKILLEHIQEIMQSNELGRSVPIFLPSRGQIKFYTFLIEKSFANFIHENYFYKL